MLQYEELRLSLLESEKPLAELKESIGYDSMKEEIKKLEDEAAQGGFWDNLENSQKVTQRTSKLKNRVAEYDSLASAYEDAMVMIELADEEGDESLFD